jgi:hypothetical protein
VNPIKMQPIKNWMLPTKLSPGALLIPLISSYPFISMSHAL